MFKVSLAFRMVTVHRYASSLSSRHMVPVEVMEESDSDEDILIVNLNNKDANSLAYAQSEV